MTFARTALSFALAISSAITAPAVVAESVELPGAPGKAEVMEACTQCHGVDILAQRRSPEEWSQVVSRMIGNGATMTDEQYKIVLAYLSTNLADKPGASTQTPK